MPPGNANGELLGPGMGVLDASKTLCPRVSCARQLRVRLGTASTESACLRVCRPRGPSTLFVALPDSPTTPWTTTPRQGPRDVTNTGNGHAGRPPHRRTLGSGETAKAPLERPHRYRAACIASSPVLDEEPVQPVLPIRLAFLSSAVLPARRPRHVTSGPKTCANPAMGLSHHTPFTA